MDLSPLRQTMFEPLSVVGRRCLEVAASLVLLEDRARQR